MSERKAALRGKYIAWGGKSWYWGNGKRQSKKEFEAIPLTTVDYPIPAHEITGQSYSLDMRKGKLTNPKTSTSYYRDSVRLEAVGSDWKQLEDLRVIPEEGQAALTSWDNEIKKLREGIKTLEETKRRFIERNFNSWEIAKFEDIIPAAELAEIEREREEKRKAKESAKSS